MSKAESLRFSIARWRAARRVVLGTVILAGSMVTSAALMYRVAGVDLPSHRITRAYTYSGIGVIIEPDGDDVVVRHVIPGTPAANELRPGMHLVSVDGTTPETLEGWSAAIRGKAGTEVNIDVAHPCKGHRNVKLTRALIRINY